MSEQTKSSVLSYFRRNPKRFLRHAGRDLRIPFSIMRKILRTLIHVFLYKMTRTQVDGILTRLHEFTLHSGTKIECELIQIFYAVIFQ